MLRTGTHMTLEGGEVDVGDKKDRLRLVFCHCLEDGDVAALVQEGHLDIWPNWEKWGKNKVKNKSLQSSDLHFQQKYHQVSSNVSK